MVAVDKDRGVCERRGDITIIRASSFANKPKLSPHHHPQNSLWSVVAPIKPAKPSLSGHAADLRTPHQQIGLGEGLPPDKGGSLPLLLYLKSITLAFTFSAPPPPSSPCQQWQWARPSSPPSLHAESSVLFFKGESHRGHTVSDKAAM